MCSRLCTSLIACVLFMPLGTAAQDILIGVIAGLSGPGASYGAGIVQGAEMAARELNASGGINGYQIKLHIVDDKTEPARSAIVMRRLLSGSPDLVVGGWGSPQVLAHIDLAEQSATPYIVVGATHPDITNKTRKWTFRVIQTDRVMTEQIARLAAVELKLKRISIYHDSNAYGSSNRDLFVTALRSHGLAPLQIQSFSSNTSDFREQLQRTKALQPDAIAIFGTVPAAPHIMRQAREIGIQARFLGLGGLTNEELVRETQQFAEGTVLTGIFNEEADQETQAWVKRYRQEYAKAKYSNPALAALTYLTIKRIAGTCLARDTHSVKAGSNRSMLRNCIAGWRGNGLGSVGEAHFDATNQLVQLPLLLEIRGGAFQAYREP